VFLELSDGIPELLSSYSLRVGVVTRAAEHHILWLEVVVDDIHPVKSR